MNTQLLTCSQLRCKPNRDVLLVRKAQARCRLLAHCGRVVVTLYAIALNRMMSGTVESAERELQTAITYQDGRAGEALMEQFPLACCHAKRY